MSVTRLLKFPDRSFFLFGPRGVGKSTWLKQVLPAGATTIDLLNQRIFLELLRDPSLLEARIGHLPAKSWVCIDEVQKAPALLDEVHRLIEARGYRFALSGSSARKLKRGGANLLAARAVTRTLETFSWAELKEAYDLPMALEFGLLPMVALDYTVARDTLDAYVHTYLREEIKEESVVRRVEPFLRFLEVAGLFNGQALNGGNIAREAQVPRSSVDTYFSILVDTLLGHFLPAYRPQVAVRERAHPKFYWFDPGVARAATGLIHDPPDPVWLGTALETLIFQELRVYNQGSGKARPLAYYRTSAGVEIDFIIETRKRTATSPPRVVCLEVKLAKRWQRRWESPMRSLAASPGIVVDRMFGIYQGAERLTFDDVSVLPVEAFFAELHAGHVY